MITSRALMRIVVVALFAIGVARGVAGVAASPRPVPSDQQQVIQLTVSTVHAWNPSAPAPAVYQVAIVNGYALTSWMWGEGGGQALLRKKGHHWSVVRAKGGDMDQNILVAFGVPPATAATLEGSLAPVPTPTP